MMKMPQIPQDRYTRAFSTAAALLLQVGFLFLMLQALKTAPLRHELSRELTLILPRLPVVVPAPAPAQNAAPPQNRVIVPEVTAPVPPEASTTPAFQSITPPSSIQGFGQALNNCAPENYANLTEDQKALCTRPGAGVTVQSAPNLMGAPSEVKDPARWANALQHEKSPPWLSCMAVARTPVFSGNSGSGGGLQGGSGPMLNPLCLAQKFADGSLTDPETWPTYDVKQLQPEDFYKIEQAYDQWHKDHAPPPSPSAPLK